MYSISEFESDAHLGNIVDEDKFIDYLNSFSGKIIWGAGNLGSAVGKRLIDLGIHIDAYWDAKYKDIGKCNGIDVKQYGFVPEDITEQDNIIIIFCIANVPVSPKLFQQLKKDGWTKTVSGLAVLEGLICPFSKGEPIDTSVCTRMEICTVCNCQRLHNIMRNKISVERDVNENELLSFDRIHFIVNNFCNLKCTHCFMYMNSYPAKRKHNVDINVIQRDIDMIFGAIDSFGVINVFGGEPFLHPELDQIVNKILEHSESFGSVIVNTNGLAKMSEKQLSAMSDKRIRLAFSNYTQALGEKEVERFHESVERAINLGYTVGVQNELPTWNISSTLGDNHYTEDEMIESKKNCGVKFLYVFDGKVFPCAFCLSLYDLGIADYETDYVDIEKCKNTKELRNKIIKMMEQPYDRSCGHCDRILSTRPIAGEQGFSERYSIPENGKMR
ncbi:radical SAM protein [Butyrivibrio sp. AD3002]|uniref:radical SAM protein n=1 Tax=Butyrivibrio sp. AD3002 TaxID=1280670 RepID=UPI0003B4849B|nr:radical SAM protein [Butyrivibrio sp. AD3002]